MPLPDALARLNRRITNPVLGRLAGRVPMLASVEHRGRRSGRAYRTPVMAFPAGPDADRWVVALTYGPNRDWVRNVTAAGAADLVIKGPVVQNHDIENHSLHLVDPRIVHGTDAALPWFVRAALRLISVEELLEMDVTRSL